MDSSEGYGLKNEGINFESNILLKNIREEVSRLSDLHRNSLKKLNVTVFEGLGRFSTQNELEIICPKTKKIKNKITSKKNSYFSWWKTKEIKYSWGRFGMD